MRLTTMRTQFVGLVAAALVVAGCGSDPGPDTGGDKGTIAISVTPASLSVVQGGSGSVQASITRGGGFTGTVNVVTEGAPAGVTAVVSNVTTSGTTTSGTVTANVAASTVPGVYTITVRASGSGVTDATTTFSLTVTAIPAIALSANPASVSVVAGASGPTTITIARTNFTGDVTLALEGAPTGVTGTFSPSPANGTTSTLTLQVAASVLPTSAPADPASAAPINLTIRGTGTGVTAATTTVQLTVTAAAAPSFDLSLAEAPTITAGTSGTVLVTVTRINGFTGTVNLALEGVAQTGITGSFAPAAVTGTTSTLTLNVPGALAAGSYPLTVRGTASGQADKTKPLSLPVVAPAGSYTLSLNTTSIIVVQNGGAIPVTVNVNRTNFTASVALAAVGDVAGLTGVLTPTSTTGNSVSMAVTATSAVPTGPHTVTVTGTAAGLSNQTVALTVNVQAPSGGGEGNVTLNFSGCPADRRPTWFAYQNGTGPWTVVNSNTNVFTFNINAGKGGLAWVQDPAGNGSAVLVSYYTQAELTSFSNAQFCPPDTPNPTKSVTAQVNGLGVAETASLFLGGGTGSASFAQTLATINGVRDGTHDLLALRGNFLTGYDKMVIRRGINTTAITAGGSVGAPIDFNDGFALGTATITLAGLGGDTQAAGLVNYLTGASCDAAPIGFAGGEITSPFTIDYRGVPADKQAPSDLHQVLVSVTSGDEKSIRTVFQSFHLLSNVTITMPNPIPVFTPSNVAGAYKTLRFQFTLPSGLTNSLGVQYGETGTAKSAIITATNGWLGGAAVDLTMPAFSGLGGWLDAWMPASSSSVQWSASASGAITLVGPCSVGTLASSTRTGEL